MALLMTTTPLAAAPKPASVYVQCDGRPNNVTAGETAARLIAITLVVGLLAPASESADASKRLTGEAGVDACTAALAGDGKAKKGEGNEIRRAELALARSAHRIEMKQYDAAIAEARALPSFAPTKATEPGFAKSLALSALEMEAAALTGAGKLAEAEAVAMRMAAAAPHDVENILRAAPYVRLTPALGEDKKAFWENAVRHHPVLLMGRADARAWAGDFRGVAGDYAAVASLLDMTDPIPSLLADEAAALMLAGDTAEADKRVAIVRTRIAALEAGPKTTATDNGIRDTRETLDFIEVAQLAAAGKMEAARTKFGARSAWSSPSDGLIAALAQRLRAGAPPAQLTGLLVEPDGALRDKAFASHLATLTDEKKQGARLYALRTYRKPAQGAAWSRKVWKVEKSKYLSKPFEPKDGAKASRFRVVTMNDIFGEGANEALLLHAALLARQEGKTGFALHPLRQRLNQALVVFGNPGDPAVPADVHLDADRIIADLSPEIPKPVKG